MARKREQSVGGTPAPDTGVRVFGSPEQLARERPYDEGHMLLGMPEGEHLVLGRGGWLRYDHPGIDADIIARVVERSDGRLEVADLIIRAQSEGVDADLLRRLSIERIEHAISSPARRLRVRDLARKEAAEIEQLMADLLDGIIPDPTEGEKERAPRIRLRIPSERRKPNIFYQRVAEAFSYLAQREKAPAHKLAEANNVPVTTVHRWVKEARNRGLLPRARSGRKGER